MANGRTRYEEEIEKDLAEEAREQQIEAREQAAANLKAQKNPVGETIGGTLGMLIGNVLLPGAGGVVGRYAGKGLGGAAEAALEGAEGGQIAKAGFGAAIPVVGDYIKQIGGTGKKPPGTATAAAPSAEDAPATTPWEEVPDAEAVPGVEGDPVAALFESLPEGFDIGAILGGGIPA